MKREENQTVEYKESWHEKYLAWICGYANAHGGTIYFGIEDKTKKPVGVKNANKLMEDIPNSIRNTMGIVADVALLRKNGKDVIRVKVKKSMFPVCYHGEYHYRTGAVKMVLAGPSLTQFLLEKSGIDWDASPTFSGFKKIFADYTEGFVNPGGHKPILESHPAYFRITLPNMIYGFTDEQLIAAAKNPKTPVVTPVATPVVTPVATPDATPVAPPVVPPVVKPSETLINEIQWKILRVLHEELLPASKLAAKIGICKVNNVRRRYLRLLLDMGLVEYTIPNKPNSKRQQYRLTVKGHELIERRGSNHVRHTTQTTTPETTQTTTPETTPENVTTTPETTLENAVTILGTSEERILLAIKKSPTITVSVLAKTTGLSIDGVKWNLRKLKALGKIRRVGYTKGGHWEVLK